MPPESRPFRFGLMLDTRNATHQDALELARRAEATGFSILLGTDHLGRWAALPLLQAVADATRLRIGTYVLNNDLRHPLLLAQELATIDLVTDGRLEIGIGAGWAEAEYEAAGIPFDPAPGRVSRLEASVRILKQALADGRVHRDADEAYPAMHLEPMRRSVQRPHPPVLVGGARRRLLSFAAREASIVAIDPRHRQDGGQDGTDMTAAAIDRKIGWVREAAGNRWAELEINIIVFDVEPGDDRRTGPPPPRPVGLSERDVNGSPHLLTGSVEEMAEQLLACRERWGISYFAMRPAHLEAAAKVVERLAGRGP